MPALVELLLGRPGSDVAAFEGDGQQVGERVGRAGEGGHAQLGQVTGQRAVERRRPLVRQREQDHDDDARVAQLLDPSQHLVADAALEEVGDEDEHGVGRPGDEPLAVGDRAVDVGATAELRREEQVDRVGQLFGEVDDGRVEDDQRGADGAQRGDHGAEDRRVHDRGGHRPGLVDGQDDVALHVLLAAPVADQSLGHDGAVLGQVVLEVPGDGAVPVDVAQLGSVRAGGAVQGSGDGGPGAVGDALLDVLDDGADDGPRGRPGRLRDGRAEADQGRDEMDVGLQGLHQLRFEEERPDPEPVDRVALHDLDDGGRKVCADVAEPRRDPRRRPAQTGAPGLRGGSVARAARHRRRERPAPRPSAGRRRSGRGPRRRRPSPPRG